MVSPKRVNELGQPVGKALDGWIPRPAPPRSEMSGRYCHVRPVHPEHDAIALHSAFSEDRDGSIWTYLPYGPFPSSAEFRDWLDKNAVGADPLFFSIQSSESRSPVGLAAYLRIEPSVGVVEVGHLCFSSALRRTRAATEAMYLMTARRQTADVQAHRTRKWRRVEFSDESKSREMRVAAQRSDASLGIQRRHAK